MVLQFALTGENENSKVHRVDTVDIDARRNPANLHADLYDGHHARNVVMGLAVRCTSTITTIAADGGVFAGVAELEHVLLILIGVGSATVELFLLSYLVDFVSPSTLCHGQRRACRWRRWAWSERRSWCEHWCWRWSERQS